MWEDHKWGGEIPNSVEPSNEIYSEIYTSFFFKDRQLVIYSGKLIANSTFTHFPSEHSKFRISPSDVPSV